MNIIGKNKIIFGGDYFPEQWPEEIWQEDIRLMKKANVNMVSLAIFAWALLQPDEATFTFDWLDKIMNLLAENDIDVCLGTSTAAQPNWLSRKYDDILLVRENGKRITYGSRQTYCINSPNYRKAVRRLVREIASHYKGHKALKLWHINNEYANKNSMCFCDNCKEAFQEWLKKKYENLDNLNECWGTVFWSEKYSSWDEINTPKASTGGRNGTKLLDYKRFLSHSFHSLYLEEYSVIREITPEVPVTTNFEGDWSKFDHSLFKYDLDIVSLNSYPDPNDPDARYLATLRYSMTRSLLGKPFMLMEQAASQVDWYPININKRPGLMRLWSYQALAHGSDSVMFFQWRASKKGAEKYHSGMVPHYGEKSRVFKEICELGSELNKLGDLSGSSIDAQVTIIMDNDSWWTIDNPYGSGTKSLDNEIFWAANGQPFPSVLISYFSELEYYFRAFNMHNVSVDIIPFGYDLSKYKVIIAPLLHMIKPGFKKTIENFVSNGGTFICTYFSGIVDQNVGVFPNGYLGPLKDILGVEIEEYDPLPINSKNVIKMIVNADGFDKQYDCFLWCDVLHTNTANVLATFGQDYYAGHPCLTENTFGKGKAYYLATRPDKKFMKDFTFKVLIDQRITVHPIPDGIELIKRSNNKNSFYFYLNHGLKDIEVKLPYGRYKDMLSGNVHEHVLHLAKYGVKILKEC